MLATVQTADTQSNGTVRFHQPHAEPPAANPAADKPSFSSARARIDEIEKLWLQGYSTYEIAYQLGERARDVGRNLREIRKRMQRAAQRQSQTLVVARCAEISREAMEAWRRSQGTQRVVTTRQKDGCPDTVTTRTEDKPGNAAFLNAALRATKTLAQLASELPAVGGKRGGKRDSPTFSDTKIGTVPPADAARLALMEVLTPEQSAALSPKQQEDFAAAFGRWKEQLSAGSVTDRADAEAPPAVADDALPPEAAVGPQEKLSSPSGRGAGGEGSAGGDPEGLNCPHPNPLPEGEGTELGEHSSDRRPTVRRVAAIRHPEWPAESFLTRAWLPPGRRFAPNDREIADCGDVGVPPLGGNRGRKPAEAGTPAARVLRSR